jgi:hypothetical protein
MLTQRTKFRFGILTYRFVFLFFVALLQFTGQSLSQTAKQISDSLRNSGTGFILLGDSSIFISRDTLIFVNHTKSDSALNFSNFRQYPYSFYQNIEQSANRSRITRELYYLVFRKPRPLRLADTLEIINSESPFLLFEGRPIGQIRIIRLDPFGESVEDTSYRERGLLTDLANRFHFGTRVKIIRQNLLFGNGDTVDARTLADNERLLRQLEMIRDAKISLLEGDGDSVDVEVVVQDIWAIALDARVHNPDSVSGELFYRNLFGYGQIFENEWAMNLKNPNKIAYRGSLEFENLFGSFIRSKISYSGLQDYRLMGVEAERGFLADKFKYAGGISIVVTDAVARTDTSAFPFKQTRQDFWAGKAMPAFSFMNSRSKTFIACRLLRENYAKRPELNSTTEQLYYNSIFFFGSLGIANSGYYNSAFVYQTGQTEDIPFGYSAILNVGREWGEFGNRIYSSVLISKGGFFNTGYIYSSIEAGGFIPDRESKIRQGLIHLKVEAFSNLFRYGTKTIRQFAALDLILGFGRLPGEYVSIADRDGIRGLKSPVLQNNSKISLNLENVIFSQSYWFGFTYSFFSFCDLGAIGPDNDFLYKNPWYSGIGMGIRVFNDNLFFRAFQLRLAWYPVIPASAEYYILSLAGQNRFKFNDFKIQKPEVAE